LVVAVDPSWFVFVRLFDAVADANVAAAADVAAAVVRAAAVVAAAAVAIVAADGSVTAAVDSAAVAAAADVSAIVAATAVAAADIVAAAASYHLLRQLLSLLYLAIAAASVLLQALDLDVAMLLLRRRQWHQRLHSVYLLWWRFCGRVTVNQKNNKIVDKLLVG